VKRKRATMIKMHTQLLVGFTHIRIVLCCMLGAGGRKYTSVAAHSDEENKKRVFGDKQEPREKAMRTTTLKLKHIYKCMMIMINRLKRYRCLRFMSLPAHRRTNTKASSLCVRFM
jgi:hypothetical protein